MSTVNNYTTGYFLNPARAKYEITDLLRDQVMCLDRGTKVLELGCGDLQVLKAVSKVRPDLELHGVDIGDLPPEIERGDIQFTQADLNDFSPPTNFSLILAIDVLEHLHVPQQLIQRAKSLLVVGGALYVSTPSVTKLFLFGDDNFYSDYTHIRPFNRKGLSRLLEDNGFVIEKLSPRAPNSGRSLPRLIYYLVRGLITMDVNYINAAISMIGGVSVEAVATRL